MEIGVNEWEERGREERRHSCRAACVYVCACDRESSVEREMNQAKRGDKAMSKTVGERKER